MSVKIGGSILLGFLVYLAFFLKPSSQNPVQIASLDSAETKKIVSQLFGYTLWDEYARPADRYNVEEAIKGIRACARGEGFPLNIEREKAWQMIAALQREVFEKKSVENLKRSEEFLATIATKPDVKVLIEKQLYYEELQDGKGQSLVQPSSEVTVHYIVYTLDNEEILNTRKENTPKQLCLADVIPGFAKGVVGMKEGARRKLYIHPNLAYRSVGMLGMMIPPQTLLIIDVEVAPIKI